VTEQVLHFLECRAPLDRPRREGVPQIVEVEVRQFRSLDVNFWKSGRLPFRQLRL
jgi:hypothetical protein